MPVFELPASAYELIVGQLEASVERSRWYEQEGFVQVPAVPRDAEQALRKATPLDGRYRVACDELPSEVLATWFERMREVIERTGELQRPRATDQHLHAGRFDHSLDDS